MSEPVMARRLTLMLVGLGFWLLVVWPVSPTSGSPLWGDIGAGVLAAGFTALVMRDIVTGRFTRLLNPVRYFWAGVYSVLFCYYVVKGNIDVAYRVLHPSMPIRPGIVKARTRLRSASARTLLANSITLTPGTLSVDVCEDGTFYVHWINVKTLDEDEAGKQILGRFEWFIKRILE
jgi:multicomponent Na+:H+ antiporter subunit E